MKKNWRLVALAVVLLVLLAALLLASPLLFLKLGDRAFAQSDYQTAIVHYEHATTLALLPPLKSQAIWSHGLTRLKQKEYELAIADFTTFLSRKPENGEAYAQRGYAYLQLGNLEKAVPDLQKAVQSRQGDLLTARANLAEAYYQRAQQSLSKPDYQAVLADLNEAIIYDAQRAEMYSLRGFVQLELNHFAEAIDDTAKASTLNPEQWPAYAYRAFALVYKGNPTEAIDDATKAITAAQLEKQDLALAYFARAYAYGATEKYNESLADATQALDLKSLNDARTTMLYVIRASDYLNLESYEKALADFTLVTDMEPPEYLLPLIHAGLGWANLMLEKYIQASDEFSSALRATPNDPWLYLHRGLAYTEQGKYTLAIDDFNKVLELNPQSAVAYTNRGIAYAARSEFDNAIADFEKALTLTSEESLRNWNQAHILLAGAAVHAKQAIQAEGEFNRLAYQTSSGTSTQKVQEFQKNFLQMRKQLQSIEEQTSLMAQKFGQAEKLTLPDWYVTYLTNSRQSLELMAEGFQLTGQVWDKTNTLVTILPQLDEQLKKASQSSALSQDSWSTYTQHLQKHEFDAARQLAASMRTELTQYQGYFQQAYNDTGLDFLVDAIQFFGKEIELTNLMDQITAAVAANDQVRLDQLLGQLEGLDAELTQLGQKMQAWDTEMTRWMQVNIQPLLDRAADKFAEAEQLGLVAANLFAEQHHSIIVKEPKRLFPSLE
jgi:tetratricopeptide (TPR) repeat protein